MWKWILLSATLLVLMIFYGGDTLTIINHTGKTICTIQITKDLDGSWGKDRLRGELKYAHSRDIHLPLYWRFFDSPRGVGYYGRALDCENNELDTISGMLAESKYFLWEVR